VRRRRARPLASGRGTIKKGQRSGHPMEKSAPTEGESPSRLIDARIKELGDWRGRTLALVRALIKQAAPDVIEAWKWRGVPVWERHHLHRRDLQERRQADLRQGRGSAGPRRAVQLQPRRQYPAGDRHPRERADQRSRLQGAGAGRRGSEWAEESAVTEAADQPPPSSRSQAAVSRMISSRPMGRTPMRARAA
jgi:hypothetical protein